MLIKAEFIRYFSRNRFRVARQHDGADAHRANFSQRAPRFFADAIAKSQNRDNLAIDGEVERRRGRCGDTFRAAASGVIDCNPAILHQARVAERDFLAVQLSCHAHRGVLFDRLRRARLDAVAFRIRHHRR